MMARCPCWGRGGGDAVDKKKVIPQIHEALLKIFASDSPATTRRLQGYIACMSCTIVKKGGGEEEEDDEDDEDDEEEEDEDDEDDEDEDEEEEEEFEPKGLQSISQILSALIKLVKVVWAAEFAIFGKQSNFKAIHSQKLWECAEPRLLFAYRKYATAFIGAQNTYAVTRNRSLADIDGITFNIGHWIIAGRDIVMLETEIVRQAKDLILKTFGAESLLKGVFSENMLEAILGGKARIQVEDGDDLTVATWTWYFGGELCSSKVINSLIAKKLGGVGGGENVTEKAGKQQVESVKKPYFQALLRLQSLLGLLTHARQSETEGLERRNVGGGATRDIRIFDFSRSDDGATPAAFCRRFKEKFSRTPQTALAIMTPTMVMLLSILSGLREGIVEGLGRNKWYTFKPNEGRELRNLLFLTAKGARQGEGYGANNLSRVIKEAVADINKRLGDGARLLMPFAAAAIREYWASIKALLDARTNSQATSEIQATTTSDLFTHCKATANGYTDGKMFSTDTFVIRDQDAEDWIAVEKKMWKMVGLNFSVLREGGAGEFDYVDAQWKGKMNYSQLFGFDKKDNLAMKEKKVENWLDGSGGKGLLMLLGLVAWRDGQKRALVACLAREEDDVGVYLPVGEGKTAVAMAVALINKNWLRDEKGKVMFIAYLNLSAMEQGQRAFERAGVSVVGGTKKNIDEAVVELARHKFVVVMAVIDTLCSSPCWTLVEAWVARGVMKDLWIDEWQEAATQYEIRHFAVTKFCDKLRGIEDNVVGGVARRVAVRILTGTPGPQEMEKWLLAKLGIDHGTFVRVLPGDEHVASENVSFTSEFHTNQQAAIDSVVERVAKHCQNKEKAMVAVLSKKMASEVAGLVDAKLQQLGSSGGEVFYLTSDVRQERGQQAEAKLASWTKLGTGSERKLRKVKSSDWAMVTTHPASGLNPDMLNYAYILGAHNLITATQSGGRVGRDRTTEGFCVFLSWAQAQVSERSEREFWKTRATKCAKWLQTAISTTKLTPTQFVWLARFARLLLKMRLASLVEGPGQWNFDRRCTVRYQLPGGGKLQKSNERENLHEGADGRNIGTGLRGKKLS